MVKYKLKCSGCGFTELYDTALYGQKGDIVNCPECGTRHKTIDD